MAASLIVDDSERRYRRVTVWLLALTLACTVLAVAVAVSIDGRRRSPGNFAGLGDVVGWCLPMLTASALAVLVARRRPENPLGWYLAAGGLAGALAALGDQWGAYALEARPGTVMGGTTGVFVSMVGLWVSWGLLAVFVPLLFPGGHLRSQRWRWVGRLGALSMLLTSVEILSPDAFSAPGGSWRLPGVQNPIGVAGSTAVLDVLTGLGLLGLFGATFVSVGSLFVRLLHADGEERQQLKVIAYASAATVMLLLVLKNLQGPLQDTWAGPALTVAASLTALVLPVAFGVAILRYRLYDVDVVIKKTVVGAGMAGFITAVYVLVVVGIGSAVGAGDEPNLALSVAATALVAVAFQPVRERVQRMANRLVYGPRATPYEAMAAFSRRVADVLSMEEVLPRMAEAAANGVGATFSKVQLFLPGGESRSATWPPGASVARFDRQINVTHHGDHVGALAVAKPPNDPLTPAEERLLTDLASQAGIALRNAQLAAELQVRLEQISAQAAELRLSRQRIVATQDAERRRVERDLHDGAQQRLVSVALLLRMARNRLPAGIGDEVTPLLAEASVELERAHAELRDLARGIHPAVLADGGLRPAIESLAERAPLPVQLSVPGERYPPAVEATAYFVASEALANVAKYANAGHVTVSVVRANGTLTVEVADDGVGGADPGRGSGLRGLVDRVAVLDGELRVESPVGGGTRVVAVLACE